MTPTVTVQALALRPIFEGPSAEEEGGQPATKSSGRGGPAQAVGVNRVDSDLDRLDSVRWEGDMPREGGGAGKGEGEGKGKGEGEGKGAGKGAAGLHEVVCLGGEGGTAPPPRRAAPSTAPSSAPSSAPPRPSEVARIHVGTWNMGAATPDYDRLGAWLGEEKADLYAVGVQECVSDEWHELLGQHFGSSYVLVAERAMGQIKLSVFVHRRHAHAVSAVETSYTPTGMRPPHRRPRAHTHPLHTLALRCLATHHTHTILTTHDTLPHTHTHTHTGCRRAGHR